MWGPANLHSFLNVMKSFCWSEPCVPNCMYIPLSMLWILTVHKKYEENSVFGCISVNLEEKSHCVRFVSQMLTGADRIFAAVYKRFNTICSFRLVAVLLKRRSALCLSPCTQLTSIRGASLHICILFTVFYQLSYYVDHHRLTPPTCLQP